MAFIGNTQQNQSYAPAVDFFSGDGSTTAFTLTRPVSSVPMVQVVIANVPQNPGSAYTISGSTITFTSAPPSGTNNIYVYYTSPNTTVAVMPQSPVVTGDVTTTGGLYAKTAFNSGYTDGIVVDYTTGIGRVTVGTADAITFYNGGPSSRNALGTIPVGSSGTVMVSGNMPAFSAYKSSTAGNQSVTTSTFTKVTFDSEEYDTNNNFASSTFTPTVAGYYQINAALDVSATGLTRYNIYIYKNGTVYKAGSGAVSGALSSEQNITISSLVYCNGSTDYIDIYVFLTGTSPVVNYAGTGATTYTYFQGVLVRAA